MLLVMAFFPKINEAFVCQNCGQVNGPAPKTCRNHCLRCLYSLYVDKDTPGDRLSDCEGLMQPVELVIKGSRVESIVFRCQKCGKSGKNKVAEDDNRVALLGLFQHIL